MSEEKGSAVPLWLPALFLSVFTFYTDDHVISGILPELADGLSVSEAVAGQLVTVFSLTIAVATPVAGFLLFRAARRTVVLTALGVFTVVNFVAALVDHYAVMVVLRIIAALAASAATPLIFASTAELAPDRLRGRYLSVLAVGITGSIAFGVPLGSWIGTALGWQATFTAMGCCGALSLLLVAASLPETEPKAPVPFREQVRALSARPISLALAGGALAVMGSVMLLTYLAPFLQGLLHDGDGVRALVFAVLGVAGTVGVFAGGWATDRLGPDRTIRLGLVVFVAVMATLAALWTLRPVPLYVFMPLVVVWGVTAYLSAPAVQARLHHVAGDLTAQALALNTSAGYLGIAVGGALGGLILSHATAGWLPTATAVTCALALGLLTLAFRGAAHGPSADTSTNDPQGATK
ncbi:MFS transporter [Streptomyces chumphonensis]|uniref:MFS transporter n=1 Tax=Streptomyces chumphonensis TaxID=1214925 RepID=UPI0029655E22|nr:MFS transporter [Streptomyces chumphonensis]